MNKTAEEILEKNLGQEVYSHIWNNLRLAYTGSIAAMEEYSKQQIISYEIWLEAELNNDASFNYGKTPEQLYDLFIASQNNQP